MVLTLSIDGIQDFRHTMGYNSHADEDFSSDDIPMVELDIIINVVGLRQKMGFTLVTGCKYGKRYFRQLH